jgi:hypothetical protein
VEDVLSASDLVSPDRYARAYLEEPSVPPLPAAAKRIYIQVPNEEAEDARSKAPAASDERQPDGPIIVPLIYGRPVYGFESFFKHGGPMTLKEAELLKL